MVKELLGGLIAPVTDIFKVRQERKLARESATAKLKQRQQEHGAQVELNDQEWEQVAQIMNGDSWKDEYLTLVVTSPYPLLIIAALVTAFTGDNRMLEGVRAGIAELKGLGVDVGLLMTAAVFVGLGIKLRKL